MSDHDKRGYWALVQLVSTLDALESALADVKPSDIGFPLWRHVNALRTEVIHAREIARERATTAARRSS